jgi:uncharacterized DUF497 family protein
VAFRFSWDPSKAASNLRKHGISFREALSCFEDPLSLTIPDPDHSAGEARFILIGMSVWRRLIVVSHADYGDEIRLIGARRASRHEQTTYEEEDA